MATGFQPAEGHVHRVAIVETPQRHCQPAGRLPTAGNLKWLASLATVLGPIPRTASRSSGRLKTGPDPPCEPARVFRNSTIRLASTSPIPGRLAKSLQLAVFGSILDSISDGWTIASALLGDEGSAIACSGPLPARMGERPVLPARLNVNAMTKRV